jgi:hypothetical protein
MSTVRVINDKNLEKNEITIEKNKKNTLWRLKHCFFYGAATGSYRPEPKYGLMRSYIGMPDKTAEVDDGIHVN